MRDWLKHTTAWFFILLFVSYTSSNALFLHVHIVDGEIYVHAHPYHKGETDVHDHSSEQLILLEHLNESSFSAEQNSTIDLVLYRSSQQIKYRSNTLETMQHHGFKNNPLRAPPAFV